MGRYKGARRFPLRSLGKAPRSPPGPVWSRVRGIGRSHRRALCHRNRKVRRDRSPRGWYRAARRSASASPDDGGAEGGGTVGRRRRRPSRPPPYPAVRTFPGGRAAAQVTVSHDDKGAGPSWHLDKLVVSPPEGRAAVVFPCGRWISSRLDGGHLSRELAPCHGGEPATTTYRLIVHTSHERGAGEQLFPPSTSTGSHPARARGVSGAPCPRWVRLYQSVRLSRVVGSAGGRVLWNQGGRVQGSTRQCMLWPACAAMPGAMAAPGRR